MRDSTKVIPILRRLLSAAVLFMLGAGCFGPLDSFPGSDAGNTYPDANTYFDGGGADAAVQPDASTDPGSLLIQLIDVQGQPVADVTVYVDDVALGTTDQLGLFCAQDIPSNQPQLVRTASSSCSTTTRFVYVAPNSMTSVQLTCMAPNVLQLPDAAAGGTIQGPDGFELQLPPGSLKWGNDPVFGPVDVHYTIVNSATAMAAAPGDMLALSGGSEVEQLESFGMVEVTFYQAGSRLTYDSVSEATLSFPLTDTASYSHGLELGLYTFDEQLGYWSRSGMGTVDTQTMGFPIFVAHVTHFSWWNCDEPLSDKSCIAGRLVDDNATPLVGAVVLSNGVDYLGSSSAVTDPSGGFCVNVKRDSLNDLSVWHIGAVDGAAYYWAAWGVQAGATPTDCDLGSCVDLGDQIVASSTALETCL